jgi:peptidoglycan/LPS O-acetylase OafA/YrhL
MSPKTSDRVSSDVAVKSASHIPSLDGIRGAAILMVLGVHIAYLSVLPQDSSALRLLDKILWTGWSGVDLFFVLSGFLITGQLLDSLGSENYFRGFYARRILRIFPLYYLALLVTAVAFPFLKSGFLRNLYPSHTGWLSYALYFQNWWMPYKENSHSILGQLWSLGVEEQFYLLWPLCVWLVGRKHVPRACQTGIVFALTLRIFGVAVLHRDDSAVILMNTLTRMDTLLVGALCAVLVRHRKHATGNTYRVLSAVGVVSGGLVLGIMIVGREYAVRASYMQSVGYTWIAFAFGCIVLFAYYRSGSNHWLDRVLTFAPLRAAGKYSYGIYVWHSWVYLTAFTLFRTQPWYGVSRIYSFLLAGGMVLTSCGVAFLSYHLFEKRFLLLKNRFGPHFVPSARQ